jgi:hypothetical protein
MIRTLQDLGRNRITTGEEVGSDERKGTDELCTGQEKHNVSIVSCQHSEDARFKTSCLHYEVFL